MTEQIQTEALTRLTAYVARRKKSKQLSENDIHAFDSGCESEAVLQLSDIEHLLGHVESLRAKAAGDVVPAASEASFDDGFNPIEGQSYQSKGHGTVRFRTMDFERGEPIYHFETARGIRYMKRERMLDDIQRPATVPTVSVLQAERAASSEIRCMGERCMVSTTNGLHHSRECIEEAGRSQGWIPTAEDLATAGPSAAPVQQAGDAERWKFVETAPSAVTLRLHNLRPDQRAKYIDAAIASQKEQP